jgi:GWxTD domain-containing protein
VDPLKRQRSARERYESQKALRQELKGTYRTWLNEEVPYIISEDEKKAFLTLSNDEERDAFIEAFWQRRNPNPDSPENEYREEHYRRIAYANEHFAAGKPGWKTDRGHIYIAFGPADDIEAHPSGGLYERTPEEGGGTTSTFPFETWHYRYLEGIGENIDLEFVDTCQCGDYHFTINRSEKDALLNVPGAGLTDYEQTNHQDKTASRATASKILAAARMPPSSKARNSTASSWRPSSSLRLRSSSRIWKQLLINSLLRTSF